MDSSNKAGRYEAKALMVSFLGIEAKGEELGSDNYLVDLIPCIPHESHGLAHGLDRGGLSR